MPSSFPASYMGGRKERRNTRGEESLTCLHFFLPPTWEAEKKEETLGERNPLHAFILSKEETLYRGEIPYLFLFFPASYITVGACCVAEGEVGEEGLGMRQYYVFVVGKIGNALH